MLLRIHNFQIKVKEIRQRCDRFQRPPGHAAAGFYTCVDAVATAKRKKLRNELRMRQGFTAGNGHSAAGAFIKHFVAANLVKNFLRRTLFPVADERIVIAGPDAGTAAPTLLPVEPVLRPLQNRTVGTGLCAAATAMAEIAQKTDLHGRLQIFRIGAPFAAQRAALQKHHRADAGAVMNGVPLNICHKSKGHYNASPMSEIRIVSI